MVQDQEWQLSSEYGRRGQQLQKWRKNTNSQRQDEGLKPSLDFWWLTLSCSSALVLLKREMHGELQDQLQYQQKQGGFSTRLLMKIIHIIQSMVLSKTTKVKSKVALKIIQDEGKIYFALSTNFY